MATATANKTSKSNSKSKSNSNSKRQAVKKSLNSGDYIRAGFFFTLALIGLMVSLPHLATEVDTLTSSGLFASWLIAIIFDLGMIASKVNISANGPAKRECWAILASCTAVSIIFNSHAFLLHADTLFASIMAIAMGIFIPLFILTLSYIGSKILLRHKD